MRVSCSNTDDPVIITGSLDINTANELSDALAGYLRRGCELILDLSGVDYCDTAALQVFLAVFKSSALVGKRARIAAGATAIDDVCAALGLSIDELGLFKANVSRQSPARLAATS